MHILYFYCIDTIVYKHYYTLTIIYYTTGSYTLQTLHFEPCHISLASYRILKLISDTLKQTYTSSYIHINNILYQTVRDILLLYISLIPIRYDNSINTVLKIGGIFYNDCQYIAHNTTLLIHTCKKEAKEYHNNTTNTTTNTNSTNTTSTNNNNTNTNNNNNELLFQSSIGLLDYIPRLRELGEAKLIIHVENQKTILLELVQRLHVCTDTTTITTNNTYKSSNIHKQSGSLVSLNLPATSKRGRILTTGLKIADQFGLGKLRSVVNVNIQHNTSANNTTDGTDENNTIYNNITNNTTADSNNNNNNNNNNANDDGGSMSKRGEDIYLYNNEKQAYNIIQYLTLISSEWSNILQISVYDRTLGHIIDSILRAIMKPVLESECISEQCGAEISRVMRVIMTAKKVCV